MIPFNTLSQRGLPTNKRFFWGGYRSLQAVLSCGPDRQKRGNECFMSSITELSDSNFEKEVSKATLPVLVDYWAGWCTPCRKIAPILEEIAGMEKYQGVLKIGKLDVENNNETTTKYGVRSIPTLALFRDGEIIATKIGSMSKPVLEEFLDTHLNSDPA